MPESQTALGKTRQVSIHERSIRVGDFIVVNGYRVNRTLLKARFAEGGYQAQETAHFLLFTRGVAPRTILVHWFASEEINADIKHFMYLELKPLGLLDRPQHYGEILAGIVGSFFPKDVRRAWHYFGANTLQQFVAFLSTVSTPPYPDYTCIGSFATQYKRICELCTGKTFLDAGCESGFLPVLIAERIPFMTRVVGLDIRPDMFDVVSELARERGLSNVEFIQADLLAEDFARVGQFDTVTAIGVIEHFSEPEMYRVLANLLKITAQRLILIVPYENEPEPVYGHEQLFTPATLESIGKWCVQHLNGMGKIWLEECVGGLLLIERS
ncbi:MAG TPA: class I SAM-dependent methyltransferase [Ktedonobacteraceae bacterium]|nr:class I SAM-dependent methyltransferase [Ktedonobacteraceae bacterium]